MTTGFPILLLPIHGLTTTGRIITVGEIHGIGAGTAYGARRGVGVRAGDGDHPGAGAGVRPGVGDPHGDRPGDGDPHGGRAGVGEARLTGLTIVPTDVVRTVQAATGPITPVPEEPVLIVPAVAARREALSTATTRTTEVSMAATPRITTVRATTGSSATATA